MFATEGSTETETETIAFSLHNISLFCNQIKCRHSMDQLYEKTWFALPEFIWHSAGESSVLTLQCLFTKAITLPLADLRGGGGVRARWKGDRDVLPSGSNFFHFHAVFRKNFGQIIGLCPHLGRWCLPIWEILDPPLIAWDNNPYSPIVKTHFPVNSLNEEK